LLGVFSEGVDSPFRKPAFTTVLAAAHRPLYPETRCVLDEALPRKLSIVYLGGGRNWNLSIPELADAGELSQVLTGLSTVMADASFPACA
jgi:hypothetical protein